MKKVFGENSQTEKPLKTGIPRLLEFSGKYKGLFSMSQILAGFSSLLLLAPFLCIYLPQENCSSACRAADMALCI